MTGVPGAVPILVQPSKRAQDGSPGREARRMRVKNYVLPPQGAEESRPSPNGNLHHA